MLVDELAEPNALVRRIAVMRAIVLPSIDAKKAAFSALHPAKDQPAFQFLRQLLELTIKQLDLSILLISFSILLEPSSNLMDPCIHESLKILIEGSQEVVLRHPKAVAMPFPRRSKCSKTFFRQHLRISTSKIEIDACGWPRNHFVGVQVLVTTVS